MTAPALTPAAITQARRILNAAARRILAESVEGPKAKKARRAA